MIILCSILLVIYYFFLIYLISLLGLSKLSWISMNVKISKIRENFIIFDWQLISVPKNCSTSDFQFRNFLWFWNISLIFIFSNLISKRVIFCEKTSILWISKIVLIMKSGLFLVKFDKNRYEFNILSESVTLTWLKPHSKSRWSEFWFWIWIGLVPLGAKVQAPTW